MVKVLLVDDDDQVREVIEEVLTGEGFSVVAVASGTEAIRAAGVSVPSVVVSDYLMPGMDGLTLFRRLVERFPELEGHLVLLTGLDESDLENASSPHFRLVHKPFNYSDLAGILKDITAQ